VEDGAVNDTDTPGEARAPSPHPLACDFARRLDRTAQPRVIVLGFGSGRNVPPLRDAGARVDIVESDPERARRAETIYASDDGVRIVLASYDALHGIPRACAGALSTHALLHGNSTSVASAIGAVAGRLAPDAPFFFTLGSKDDPRYGAGREIDRDTYAPLEGSEAGVPHVYFDEAGVHALLHAFEIEDIRETSAAETAGSWAHAPSEAATLRHWFVRARKIA